MGFHRSISGEGEREHHGVICGGPFRGGFPEHARWSTIMLEPAARVGVNALILLLLPFELSPEEGLGNFDLLASHNDDTLAAHQLSSDNAGKAATEMTTPVNNNLLFEHA